ncbi:MAG TPA: hypothetical protein VF212_07065 [Longimicrobiales bacterium]
MAGLDFKRATDLFLGSERELALALGISEAELRAFRREPHRAPDAVLDRLARVLIERGRGMIRVGELLGGA